MRNAWSDMDADRFVESAVADGLEPELGARIYTTRLLGRDPDLVLHGGGNTSVKVRRRDRVGDEVDVLCVKGSGWSMDAIEAPGLPAVRLEPLRRLRALSSLDDLAMVSEQRSALLDATAPNPSVETLLHAFLPHRFIDHTHAAAVLAHSDQPDGLERLRALYGDRAIVLPWIMPGFALAKAVADAFDAHPGIEGVLLDKHGIVSMGDTAREAYDRMIELVNVAERALPVVTSTASAPPTRCRVAEIAVSLRAATRLRNGRPFIVRHRTSDQLLAAIADPGIRAAACRGVVTPDHVIRTKPSPLLLPAERHDHLIGRELDACVRDAVSTYERAYEDSFARNARPQDQADDAMPRVALVEGVGLFALAATARGADATLDLAELGLATIRAAEAIGRYEPLNEAALFEVEYWPLERAKVASASEPQLARRVVVVTGGAGAIGTATAHAFQTAGAEIALLDIEGAVEAASEHGGLGVMCDVTDPASVRDAFESVCAEYGGVDIIVSNAGAAWSGRIGDVEESVLHESFGLNFFAHQRVAQAAVRVMRRQGGGCLLFNVSKQAVNPGPDFGPYGLPKAALMALVRQYAVDHGRDGIRANGVNADRIRSGLLTEEMIRTRSSARGVSASEYMEGNLLEHEVTADDVAQAFVALARARATTGAIMTVDGGNAAAALR